MSEKQNGVQEIVHVNSTPMVVAEIESQIATAKQYPRNISKFKDKVMSMANLDQSTAEGCFYALPRGGKSISGPSIRFAEIALSCYGNAVAKAEVTGEDDKYVYATGMCRDLENNVAISMTVKRKITDRNGRRFNDDMIVVTSNAACAIALRNAIFKIVPAAYTQEAFDKVKQTAVGDAQSFANRRADVLARLQKMGVDESRVLSALKRASVDELTINDVTVLIGLGTAVHDGDTTLDEAFPEPIDEGQEPGAKGLEQRLANEAQGKGKNSESTDAPASVPKTGYQPAHIDTVGKSASKATDDAVLKEAQTKADKKAKKATKKTKKKAKPKVRTCRVCGCTDDNACVDNETGETCGWVGDEDLCTMCEAKMKAAGTSEPKAVEEAPTAAGWHCNNCKRDFPEPKNPNADHPICFHCLSENIVEKK